MTARPPRQQAALDKFTIALSMAIGDACIERMSDAEIDDAFAAAIGALTTRDVAAFWPPPRAWEEVRPQDGGGSGCADDFVDLPPSGPAATCAIRAHVARPAANVSILPVVRIERPGIDLARQACAADRPDVIQLRRRG